MKRLHCNLLYLIHFHLQRNFFYLKEIIELYFKDHEEIRLNMKLDDYRFFDKRFYRIELLNYEMK